MRRITDRTSTLIVALLLTLYSVPAVGYGPAADQPLNRGADAARFAPAVPGVAVGDADLVERAYCPEADPAQSALLPGAVRPAAAQKDARLTAEAGRLQVLSCQTGTIPIRAPPFLPLR